ncbi:MAG TPA: hypothetical protein EYQ25_10400 [Planctomycetes bacterium]|nr:hypothetical protein [Planctomycetota bacterium]HIL38177.1 hypothetical protein [Planctomycetota bacterium]
MFRRPKVPLRVIHPIVLERPLRPLVGPSEGSWMLVPARTEASEAEKRVPSTAPRALGPQDRKDPDQKLRKRLGNLMQRIEDQADELDSLRSSLGSQSVLKPMPPPRISIPGRDRKTGKRHAAAMRAIFEANVALRRELAHQVLDS